jgi:hypothetical protein
MSPDLAKLQRNWPEYIMEAAGLAVIMASSATVTALVETHVDSSFFPSSSAVNPTLTIIANAIRVADHLKERLH